jgi:hypothetical protein
MTARFEVHEHRNGLKQLKDTGDTQLYDNRKDVVCPACGDPFRRLFVTEQETTSFPENDGARFCLLVQSNDVLLFLH